MHNIALCKMSWNALAYIELQYRNTFTYHLPFLKSFEVQLNFQNYQ